MKFTFFPSLFETPDKIHYCDQEEDERIELMLRQHWVTNIPWIVIALIAIIAPPIIIQLNNIGDVLRFILPTPIQIPSNIWVAVVILWYMLTLVLVIEKFLFWYFNVYIVTNKHLIDIDFNSLLSRDITESQIRDVQSLSTKLAGIIGQIFYFGDVTVETAAKKQKIEFLKIPRPDFVADRIQDLEEELTKK